jgi:hypothetical protein
MIGHFPVAIFVPGLLFLASGFYYHSRAAGAAAGELGARLVTANRHMGNIALVFGLLLLVVGAGLGIAIQQLLQTT